MAFALTSLDVWYLVRELRPLVEDAYVDKVAYEMLPEVAEKHLARFCDVFCEKGAFTVQQSRKILDQGRRLGLRPKVHADQLSRNGGAELAAAVGAISAGHLDYVSDAGVEALARAGVVAVLLPGAVFFLGMSRYAPAVI